MSKPNSITQLRNEAEQRVSAFRGEQMRAVDAERRKVAEQILDLLRGEDPSVQQEILDTVLGVLVDYGCTRCRGGL